MSCDFEFPKTFPGGCVSEVITGLRNGTLLDNPRTAIRPVAAVVNYGIGLVAQEQPTPIGSAEVPKEHTEAELADGLQAALDQHQSQSEGVTAVGLPIPWFILTPLLIKALEKLFDRLSK